jgi:hypothetical protein
MNETIISKTIYEKAGGSKEELLVLENKKKDLLKVKCFDFPEKNICPFLWQIFTQ